MEDKNHEAYSATIPFLHGDADHVVVITSKQEQCNNNISGASFISTCFNGINALSGIGIISLPYAMASGGWLSLILLLVIASSAFYTGLLIQRCMDTDPTIRSYTDIGDRAFGKTGKAIVSITMNLEVYLIVTGFLILEGDNLSNLFPNMKLEVYGYHISSTCGFIVLVSLIILPTCWLKNMNILSFVSASGVIASMIILGSVFWVGVVADIGFQEKGKLVNWNGLPSAISLYAFCYSAHPVFPTLYTSMRNQRQFSKTQDNPQEDENKLEWEYVPHDPKKMKGKIHEDYSFTIPFLHGNADHAVVITSKQEQCNNNISGASFISTCFNGLNALSGVGIVSLPYAMASGGWLSLILLLVIASSAFYTGLLIQRCMDADPTITSYNDIGDRAFGKTGKVIVSITMNLEVYLAATGFLILEGDNLSNLFPNMELEVYGHHISSTCGFIVLVSLIILPTCWLRNMNILSFVSASGVLASMIILGSVFWAGAVDDIGFQEKGKLVNWNGLPSAISLYAFCYSAHPVFPTLYTSMRNQRQKGVAAQLVARLPATLL